MQLQEIISRFGRLSLLILVTLCLTNCLDEIDLAQGARLPDGIVFQGRINAGVDGEPSDVRVRLERLFIAQESNRPSVVVTATVVLENTEGQTLTLPYVNGAYRATIPNNDPNFRVEAGVGYRIRVNTREGEAYETEYDVLPAPLAVEDVRAVRGFVEVENAVGVLVDEPVFLFDVTAPVAYPNGDPTFLRWTLERTYKVTDDPTIRPFDMNDPKPCYVTRAFEGGDLILFSSLESTADRVENFPLTAQQINFEFAEGYAMTIFQEAISEEAFRYFNQVDQIASRESSLFEPPAGPVVGNAYDVNGNTENVFGFFYATNRTFDRVFITPADADNPSFFCPLPAGMSPFPQPNDCDNCLFINGSDTVRPVWFPF